MADLKLVKKGKVVFGVCKGLEAAGKGSAFWWRLIFVVLTLIAWLPLFVYIGMAIFIPSED